MASLQSKSTFSFKYHLTGEAWPACFQKFHFWCPEGVVAPANWISKVKIAQKSKLLYGDMGKDLSTFNLAAPRSVATQQTVYVVAPTLQLLTISLAKPFLSDTTWQARHGQLAEQFYLFIQTPLDRRGMASCPRSVPTQQTVYVVAPTLQLLTISCKLNFENSFLDILKWL